jgi:hypothetical protein
VLHPKKVPVLSGLDDFLRVWTGYGPPQKEGVAG